MYYQQAKRNGHVQKSMIMSVSPVVSLGNVGSISYLCNIEKLYKQAL